MDQSSEPDYIQTMEQDGPPASIHTEKVILGAMLSDPIAVVEATAMVSTEDFYLDSHRRIYDAMMELSEVGHSVDFITVSEELTKRKELSQIGGRPYLISLTEDLPRHLAIGNYVRTLKRKSMRRQIIAACEIAMHRALDESVDESESLAVLEGAVLDIADNTEDRDFESFVEILDGSGGVDAYVEKTVDPERAMGLQTGMVEIDQMTYGLRGSELIIVAARPSMGKTAWAMSLVLNACRSGDMVAAVFSLEMSKEALFHRLLAAESRVNIRRASGGEFVDADSRARLRRGATNLGAFKIHIDDTSQMTVLKMRSKCRRLKQREGRLDIIVIDYLQLMQGGKKRYSNRQEEVAEISRGLKAVAKDFNVPVVALAQLSRLSESHADKRPLLSSLRESGQIEQDGDLIAFIHREEYYDPSNTEVRGLAEFIIAKQRDGPTGTVHLAYLSDFTKFENLSRM